jgi:hypothetical protein
MSAALPRRASEQWRGGHGVHRCANLEKRGSVSWGKAAPPALCDRIQTLFFDSCYRLSVNEFNIFSFEFIANQAQAAPVLDSFA